jgi:hypothetical protein
MAVRIPVLGPLLVLLYLAPVALLAQTFTKVLTGPVVTDLAAARSAHWIDYDKDGDLDLFVTRGKAGGENNMLYRNDGAPGFSFTAMTGLVVSQDGQPSDGATWGDYDNDGDDDLFVVNWYGISNMLYRNDGSGAFTRILTGPPVSDGGYSETASWGDYDNDGFLDLAVSNSAGDLKEFLYHNNGDGTFSSAPPGAVQSAGWESRGLTWIDYDEDGDLDLFVTNETNQNEFLFRNMHVESGVDTFQRVLGLPIVTAGGSSWSGSWGDYDNDGDLDLFVANTGNQNNALFNNQGAGVFTRMPTAFGDVVDDSGFSASGTWVDADNDGDLDLYVSNAYGAPVKNFYYRNLLAETGGATFQRELSGAFVNDVGYTYGFAWGDYDQDGDVDLFCARTLFESQASALYRNDGNANHWLSIDLKGTVSNGSAIGARIRVLATIGGVPVWQLRVVEGQQGYCAQTLQQHVGLGDAATADSLIIAWPSGLVERFGGLAADRWYGFTEGGTPAPALVSPEADAQGQLPTLTFRWRATRLGAPYHLQVGTDSTFSSGLVYENPAAGDTAVTVDSLPNTTTLFWRVRQVRALDTALWSPARKLVVGASTYRYGLRERWNLVSVPVTVASYRSVDLFTAGSGPAYAYEGGHYAVRESLVAGHGYWLRSDTARTLEIAGVPLPPETLAIAPGWNLIGSRAWTSVPGELETDPPGLFVSPVFGYDGGYGIPDSLVPFRGYWVYASGVGALLPGEPPAAAATKYAAHSWDAYARLEITDAAGNSQRLYLAGASPGEETLRAAAPPPPPAGAFDARFADGSLVGATAAEPARLVLRGAAYPVTLRWSGNALDGLVVEASGKSAACGREGSLRIASADALVSFRSGLGTTPSSSRLEQNYPNPFNPATIIAFTVASSAEQVRTTLDVFDLLGRHVESLVAGVLPAGEHRVRWDAGGRPGGVYYCRLQSGERSETRRMLLVR